ncbi:hypothetical protein RJ640_003641 [Escallonia rubra]|uniref:Uncharacterized protein n=1 Tax=Escallonia rubra TaxID=112253 RepID=A0AA88S0Z3_9ASTE|nr:hypothetical protein RJ640_003641 [Escallonia rubra]
MSNAAYRSFPPRGFSTPPATSRSKQFYPVMPRSERRPNGAAYPFHVIHKVPAGDSPYVRAKHVQLVDKDPTRAISMFWAAINSGDRVDSALKDMAVVMKQLNRSDEAIEAIKSFRHLCPLETQESLDNVLVELYKRSGRIEEQIEMLELRLKHIEEGIAFGRKKTKAARSQGKKVQITIEQEYLRLLGNLAWAYMQQNNFKSAEEFYRKALSLQQDKNKQCNLAICLMHMNRMTEARFLLQTIKASSGDGHMDESFAKSFERAMLTLAELECQPPVMPAAWEEDCRVGMLTAFRKQGEDKSNYFRFNKGVPQCTSFGQRHGLHFFSQTMASNESYTGGVHERKADFGSKRNENWVGKDGVEACKKAHASPSPSAGTPRVPFTQPRRCPWSLNNGLQRRACVQADAAGNCNRKLSFEKPIYAENAPVVNDGVYGELPSSRRDLRKMPLGYQDTVNGDSVVQPNSNGQALEYVKAMEASSDGNFDQSCSVANKDSVKLTAAENQISTKEFPSQSHPTRGNLKDTNEFLIPRCKKSWADWAEESSSSEASPFSLQSPNMCSDGCISGEEINDENINSNIVCGTPCTDKQTQNLSQKIKSLDLKTQPEKDGSRVNRGVRRSLCFDRLQRPDKAGCFCPSPLTKKALYFEGSNSAPTNESEPTWGNGIKLPSRNRLQVFQDIALDQSPCL